ncbi:MAG: hypothetical protein GY834_09220 [Bacteroidetes bacterium]|nr:hypothetical protein [Bacteroidota bacterium]
MSSDYNPFRNAWQFWEYLVQEFVDSPASMETEEQLQDEKDLHWHQREFNLKNLRWSE